MSLRRSSARRAASCLALSACLLPACADDAGSTEDETGAVGTAATAEAGSADGSGEPAPFDEAEVIEQAGQYATALVQINDTSFPSQHGLAATVNVFVDAAAADLYRTLDPAAPTEVDFPEGTLIVKEHLDADGAEDGYLLMYRGPEGYDPDASDWFWARVDGSGTTQETGAVGFCIGCHAQVAGHVFGVETDNRL